MENWVAATKYAANVSYYKRWEKDGVLPDKLAQISTSAREGLTNDKIAQRLEISLRTFQAMLKKHSDVKKATEQGKAVIVDKLESRLLQKAMGYTYGGVAYPPDTTCIIYALKVYGGKRFNDRLIDMNLDVSKAAVSVYVPEKETCND